MVQIEEFNKQYNLCEKELIGEGYFSECFKLEKDKVYKKFKKPFKKNSIFFEFEKLIKFEGLKFNNIIFPQSLIVDNTNDISLIFGYMMPHVKSNPMEEININNIIKNIELLEKEIKLLTKDYSLYLFDANNPNNIIINNESANIIDTDLYEISNDKYLLNSNIGQINYGLFEKIVGKSLYSMREIPKYLNELRHEIIEGNIFISSFIKEYVKYLEHYISVRMDNIGDLRRVLK